MAEFRVSKAKAESCLGPGVGEDIGSGVIRIVDEVGGPLWTKVGLAERQLRAQGDILFTSWSIQRRYSPKEMADADLLHVLVTRTFEPCGEECGTQYDDTSACRVCFAEVPGRQVHGVTLPGVRDECGVGARQVGPLALDIERVPGNLDIAQTIAGEVIVSRRFVGAMTRHGISGLRFDNVEHDKGKKGRVAGVMQMTIVGDKLEFDEATRFGEDPFDGLSKYRCPKGHTAGLAVLSEVSVKEWMQTADWCASRQMVGVRRGLLRPSAVMLVSPRTRRVVEEEGLKGLEWEVAKVVP